MLALSTDLPVRLFNFHGYRTWMPDHPRGFTLHNVGTVPPNPELAKYYQKRAKFDRVLFDATRQRTVIGAIREVCQRIGVRLYYTVCVNTHAHAVVAWDDPRDWTVIYDRMKRIIGFKLAKSEGVAGRRWLAARRAGKIVRDSEHLRHLMCTYLPNHHGVTWVDEKIRARVNTRDQ